MEAAPILGRRVKNIIFEGVECAGKTTLIDEIRRKIPGWDLKFLAHKDGDQFQRYMWEYMVNSGTLFNRSHFSEVVYGRLRNRQDSFTPEERQVLDKKLIQDNLVIFCDPNIDDVLARYAQRPPDKQPVAQDELRTIHGLFQDVFKDLPVVRYVSTDMNARDTFVQELPKLISK